MWLNNGMSVKRFDAVSFPEVLNMGSYVYQKESPMLRARILDLDGSARLVGGRKKPMDETKTSVQLSLTLSFHYRYFTIA